MDEQPATIMEEVQTKLVPPTPPVLDLFSQVWQALGLTGPADASILVASVMDVMAAGNRSTAVESIMPPLQQQALSSSAHASPVNPP